MKLELVLLLLVAKKEIIKNLSAAWFINSMWKGKLAFIINTFIYSRREKRHAAAPASNKNETAEHSDAEAASLNWLLLFGT